MGARRRFGRGGAGPSPTPMQPRDLPTVSANEIETAAATVYPASGAGGSEAATSARCNTRCVEGSVGSQRVNVAICFNR